MYTQREIEERLDNVYSKFGDIRLGVAGSYSRGDAEQDSDVDIVIEGDSMRVDIMEYIKNIFNGNADVLWMDLLKQEDEKLDKLFMENDLPLNQNSVYKNVLREVKWHEKVV